MDSLSSQPVILVALSMILPFVMPLVAESHGVPLTTRKVIILMLWVISAVLAGLVARSLVAEEALGFGKFALGLFFFGGMVALPTWSMGAALHLAQLHMAAGSPDRMA
jgi:ABC-type sugar transport system permease subunit